MARKNRKETGETALPKPGEEQVQQEGQLRQQLGADQPAAPETEAEPAAETADRSDDKKYGAAFGVGSTDETCGVGHTDEVYNLRRETEDLRREAEELKKKLNAAEQRTTFMDRLGAKLFGLTSAERFRSWNDTSPFVTPWQERLARVVGNAQTRFTDFFWSTVGTWWDMLPPTLRPAIVERHLPRYRWCISSGSDEVFLSGVAHSAEKASEDARTVAAILKGVFEVIRRRPNSVTPPAFSHVVYFENGTKAIPETKDGYTWKSSKAARVVSQVQAS